MVCSKCGNQNNDSSKFCISCGNVLQNINQPTTNNNLNNFGLAENFSINKPTNQENVDMINRPSIVQNESVINQPMVNENNVPLQESQKVEQTNFAVNNSSSLNFNNQPMVNENNVPLQESQKVGQTNFTGDNLNPAALNNQPKEKKKIKLNKKQLFIIGGAVLAIIIITVVMLGIFGGDKSKKDVMSLFDLDQVIPVKKDGGYVYIDTKGKMPKNMKYNRATEFYSGFAYVELEDGTSALIDKNQNIKVKATGYSAIDYIEETNSWLIDGVLYDKNLNVISDKSLQLTQAGNGYFKYNSLDLKEYGIINSKGKVVYKCDSLIYDFDVADYSDSSEYGIIVIQKGSEYKEYLIALKDGSLVYENKNKDGKYSYSNSITESYNGDGIFYITDDNYDRVETFYVKDKNIVYTLTGDIYDVEVYGANYIQLDYGYSYEDIPKEQRYYYYDLKNKKLLLEEPEIEDIELDTEEEFDITQRQVVRCDNGYGLIDDKKVIIPCMYDDIEELPLNVHEYILQKESKDLMYVEKKDKVFIYDANAKKEYLNFVDEGDEYSIVDDSMSLFIVQNIYVKEKGSSYSKDLTKVIVYNLLTKQKMEFDSASDIEIKLNYFKETKNGKTMYYNMSFEKIYTES